jgi:hypothetical protein
MYNFIKPEWFKRRKYSGWGLTPISWQGWLSLVLLVLPIVFLLSKINEGAHLVGISLVLFLIYFVAFMIFIFGLMSRIKTDERNRAHEAIADRNALWVLIIIISVGLVLEGTMPELVHSLAQVNPFIVGGMLSAWIVKVISIYWLDTHD